MKTAILLFCLWSIGISYLVHIQMLIIPQFLLDGQVYAMWTGRCVIWCYISTIALAFLGGWLWSQLFAFSK